MTDLAFHRRLRALTADHNALLRRRNRKLTPGNGIYDRYAHPVLTADHVPLSWRYDFDPKANPFLMQRMGVNSVFNAGAIEFKGRIVVMARVEGWDRKSFFAVAESRNGIDGFRFWDYPVILPDHDEAETNVYDMRLVRHEDGWIYGLFCAERHDDSQPGNLSAAVARCGIARTRDLVRWERLPDLQTRSPQQRNVVLHPRFVRGRYAFYTRPLTHFAATGTGEGIGWGVCDDITRPVLETEAIMDRRAYHTIKEGKNGLGPAPIETPEGWLHLAHGVRDTAAGMRYVLYLFLADRDDPSRIRKIPGGYFLAPEDGERVGDVSNVVFSNGWVARSNGDVFLYYGASDTRLHVATTTVAQLLDYVCHTPVDGRRSAACVQQRCALIRRNLVAPKTRHPRRGS
ncbi:MAG TPA: glycosidase [Verrucomicrobiota bacterium]|nr:glycosidase [Verrucomicrobiota bacterium]HNU50557.1 glycosidase [Verrucomicrobiota bacterium]